LKKHPKAEGENVNDRTPITQSRECQNAQRRPKMSSMYTILACRRSHIKKIQLESSFIALLDGGFPLPRRSPRVKTRCLYMRMPSVVIITRCLVVSSVRPFIRLLIHRCRLDPIPSSYSQCLFKPPSYTLATDSCHILGLTKDGIGAPEYC
jgi:hypothetical protein